MEAQDLTDNDTVADTSEDSSPDTLPVSQTHRDKPWLFARGHDPRRNVLGRIKKAPTVWDETQKLASKSRNRKRIAQAHVETMQLTDAAGNRARADYHDRDVGTVAHRMVVEHEDAAGLAWLEALATGREPLYIEEGRGQDADADADGGAT